MGDLDNVDAERAPTASQVAGLTLAAARRMISPANNRAQRPASPAR